MERNSILHLLRSQDLTEKKIELFREKLKDKNFTLDDCDKLLKKMGHKSLFSFEDEFYDDEDDYEDFEPILRKKVLMDE
jgi:hypothetical protein